MKQKIYKTVFLLILFVGVSVTSSQAEFKVVGYVPNWINVTNFANSFDFSRVTHLNIAFKDPDANGNLPTMSTGEDYLIVKAHEHNVKVLLSIAGGNSSENSAKRTIYFNLINASNRSGFASKLKAYALDNDLDGIDLDLEGPAINGDYGTFVQVLSDSLKPAGLLLTSALSQGYGGASVPTSTFPYFDWINIMAYDATGTWVGAPAGQHSSYQFAIDNLDYWKNRGLPAAKAILGVPFYGYGFNGNAANGNIAYKNIIALYPGFEYDDEAGSTIWYNGINTIIDKTSLAFVEGGGIMIWELSNDATGDNSLLKAISETAAVLSVEEQNTIEASFSVFPNPTSGRIEVKGFDLENSTLKLVNAIGEEFTEVKLDAQSALNLSAIPKGIYYLSISNGSVIHSEKIILY